MSDPIEGLLPQCGISNISDDKLNRVFELMRSSTMDLLVETVNDLDLC